MQLNALSNGYKFSNKNAMIFVANFITVNKTQPTAEAVATIDGQIVAVGSKIQVENYLNSYNISFKTDTSFSDYFLTPGFIEAHMHTFLAAALQERIYYVGQVDRTSTSGQKLKAAITKEDVINRLKEIVKKYSATDKTSRSPWVDCWGFDPLLVEGQMTMDKSLLDEICPNFPIIVAHASLHLATLNSKALELCEFSVNDNPHYVERNENQELTGNIAEHDALFKAIEKGGMNIQGTPQEQESFLIKLSEKQVAMGVTSMVDAGAGMPFNTMPLYETVSKNEAMRVRHHPYPLVEKYSVEEVIEYRKKSNPMLSVKRVKFVMTDGSIQGFTANLPENTKYYNQSENGVSRFSGEEIYKAVLPFHKAGFNVSFHCNGDGMTETLLDVFELLQRTYPREDARHCLEHNQLVTEEQLARMADLGVVHNLFASHIAVWGDVHAKETVGPARVKTMEPCRSSINHGVRFSLHSDDSVTECNPLFSMWAAVNRKCLFSGKTYGNYQKITAEEALEAVTLGAAYISNEDDVKGSIEPGKYADFAILEENPITTESDYIKDISILGTILGGKVQLAKAHR